MRVSMAPQSKFTFLLITGSPAVGKFTVGSILAKKNNIALFHNHLIIDLVKSLIPGAHNKGRSVLRQKILYDCLDAVAQQDISLIITHAYGHGYVYSSGITDQQYVARIRKIAEKYGGNFVSVHLVASKKTLMQRVREISRKKFKKITTKKLLNEVIMNQDIVTPPFKDSLVIPTESLTASQTVKLIEKHVRF